MRICLIGPTHPFRGGISHYTTLLYHHLRKRHDVHFLSFKRQYPKVLFPGRSDKDPSRRPIQVREVSRIIDSMNPATWVHAAVRVVKQRPDLVIIPWWVSFWGPPFWLTCTLVRAFSRSKILFLCHNVVEHESVWVDKAITRLVLRKGHYFIVHSHEDRTALHRAVPGARVLRAFHPTYEAFNFGEVHPERIRARYDLRGGVVLFFGFVRDYKGLRYLLEAFPEVLSRMEATLLVVGEFWRDKPKYIQKVEELQIKDRVVFVDRYVPNEEVGDFFAVCDLVVQPYTSATGSGVIQMAFGFNRPVIATRVGCLPEVVQDGRTGYLVPPEDPKAIAGAVLRFFEEGRGEAFGNNIREENKRFSWERMVDVIEYFGGSGHKTDSIFAVSAELQDGP